MFPILFRIPLPNLDLPWLGKISSLPIFSYGVMLGLSIVLGWYLTLGLASRDFAAVYSNEEQQERFRDTMANCYIVTAVVAIIGSRLLYAVTKPEDFQTFSDLFAFRKGGLVAYGGFLGGFLGSWWFLRRKKISLMLWADWAVPSLATGLMITRIGCYLYGCDFGKPLSDTAPQLLKTLGTFPHWPEGTMEKGSGAPAWVQHFEQHLVTFDSKASLPVHPTQLYESLVGLSLLVLLMYQRKHQKFRGQVFLIFTFAYGTLRYLLEILRDDEERGTFGFQAAPHWLIPGGLFLFGLAFAFGIAKTIENEKLRPVAQVLALVPAIAAFLMLKPTEFAKVAEISWSTSQWVGLVTGIAAAVFYGVILDGSKSRPKAAMALGLEGYLAEEGELVTADATKDASTEQQPKKKKKKKRAAEEEKSEQASGDENNSEQGGKQSGEKSADSTSSQPEGESGSKPSEQPA